MYKREILPPKAQRFITSTAAYHGAVRGNRGMKDTRCVPRKFCHFDKGRILPDTELILRVAVRAEQLLAGCGPNQAAYLKSIRALNYMVIL